MNYVEVSIKILPFSEEMADLLVAQLEELPFESFVCDEPFLKAYIPQDVYYKVDIRNHLSIFDNRKEVKLSVDYTIIEHKNWNEIWESNFSPIIIGDKCTIKAEFHTDLPPTKYVINIEPKMAFGTGHHNTTYLMLENMLEMDFKDKCVLDMGAGTAILAILAVKMGAALPVYAIDIDPIAVESSIENSQKNGVGEMVKAIVGDSSRLESRNYDIILANINRNIIISDLKRYSSSLKPRGQLLLSGFYNVDVPMIDEEAKKYGLKFALEKDRDRWAFLKYIKA